MNVLQAERIALVARLVKQAGGIVVRVDDPTDGPPCLVFDGVSVERLNAMLATTYPFYQELSTP